MAATFTVTSTADTNGGTCGSGCTLRQAINAADAAGGQDTIRFALAGSTEIALGSELPAANDAAGPTIDGAAATTVTVDGGNAARVGVALVHIRHRERRLDATAPGGSSAAVPRASGSAAATASPARAAGDRCAIGVEQGPCEEAPFAYKDIARVARVVERAGPAAPIAQLPSRRRQGLSDASADKR
jgi:CSLREA domain-containing protein